MTEHRGSPDTSTPADGLWERVRAEERADKLTQVAQDADRDARLAALLDAAHDAPRPS